jgi:hypothetical protein
MRRWGFQEERPHVVGAKMGRGQESLVTGYAEKFI